MVDARPLHAYVAKSNVASIRVLEKCGFVKVGEHAGDDRIRGAPPGAAGMGQTCAEGSGGAAVTCATVPE